MQRVSETKHIHKVVTLPPDMPEPASVVASDSPPSRIALRSRRERLEDALSGIVLIGAVLLPLLEIAGRRMFDRGIPGSIGYVQHLTLWLCFLGGALAARDDRHLSLSAIPAVLKGSWKTFAGVFANSVATAIATMLGVASAIFVWTERQSVSTLGGGLPLWCVQTIMPVGFGLIAWRIARKTPGGWKGFTSAILAALCCALLGYAPDAWRTALLWPGLAVVLAATALGAPVFTLLGGAALLLFYSESVPIAAIPVEAYRLAASPTLPTIPLFTLAGAILAQGGASRRLTRVFRALFGWMPGGTAIAAIAVSAFFTTFTGASGVTILALGALLLPILLEEKYGENFSQGMLTAAGSLGVVFPPCLPVILYGVISHTPIDNLFIAGLVPGLVMLTVTALYSIRKAYAAKVERHAFQLKEAAAALRGAKWEMLLPPVVLVAIFSGYVTLVEAAALTALYAFVVEFLVHKDITIRKEMIVVLRECATMVGGVLIILSAAMGFTNYLVDAEVPARAAQWVQLQIHSQWGFLLALNLFLLVVGCLMDIFSAIVVVVPLITPIAEAFQVNPLHLGIIFLVNMELGYITPPVGMNLFLASFRFRKPLGEIYRDALPFLIVMALGVLLITYIPAFTIGVVQLFTK